MKKIFLALALLTSTAFAALTEVDKSIYSERNLIINPGFENGKNSWLSSSATLTATTTAANVLYGTASGSILISSNGGYVRTKTVAVPTALYGQACEARVLFKGGDALTTFEVYNRDNELLGSLALKALSAPGYESVFFPCPTAAQVSGDADDGFIYAQIKQTTAGTHTVMYTDSWYMGGLTMLGEATLPDVFSAKVSNAGVVSEESVDWINGNASIANTSEYTITFNSGIFSVAPNCVSVPGTYASGGNAITVASIDSTTSSSLRNTMKQGGSFVAAAFQIYCMKQGADAKQSVQVYKSIPKVADNINTFVASVSDTGVVSGENTDWINGNCTATGTNNATFTCTLQSLGISNTPVCNITLASSTASSNVVREMTFSTSQIVYKTATSGGTFDAEAATISCTKASTDFKMPVVQPVFIGQVTQPSTTGNLKMAAAKVTSVCSSSPCTLVSNYGISSVTRTTTGRYSANFEASYFSSAPNCWAHLNSGTTAQTGSIAAATTSAWTFVTSNSSGTDTDGSFDLTCIGY